MRILSFTRRSQPNRQRGLSVVELMVGLAVGLFVVGGVLSLFVNYLGSNRRLILETRVNQDLRAAADLIVRDLRRAGYWQNASNSIWNSTTSSFNTNSYRAITVGTANGYSSITFGYAKDNNDTLDTAENRGFQIGANGSLQTLQGGSWQSVTDPQMLSIQMTVNLPVESTIDLWNGCPCLNDGSCVDTDFASGGTHYATRPRAVISDYTITLQGISATDPSVKRSITERVRIRNDKPEGTCP
ncbi:PilW family protein [Caldimonas sp. KR1-144]|uniref:PilW family protein n=1 Tax=Caldimonas sp. KR1-144 TaxID=3400911 RepID=UPI003BFF61F2